MFSPAGMKFGKQLARVVTTCDPEWSPFWVNYKFLKKRLKEFPSTGVTAVGGPHSSGASFASSDHSVHDLRQSSNEVRPEIELPAVCVRKEVKSCKKERTRCGEEVTCLSGAIVRGRKLCVCVDSLGMYL